ncbi:hypothetical protein TNCV_2472901 [Trichonephila clavipes]|nr:hypothetical protein TNCV_2472901 [Trichonephila clavipes]
MLTGELIATTNLTSIKTFTILPGVNNSLKMLGPVVEHDHSMISVTGVVWKTNFWGRRTTKLHIGILNLRQVMRTTPGLNPLSKLPHHGKGGG